MSFGPTFYPTDLFWCVVSRPRSRACYLKPVLRVLRSPSTISASICSQRTVVQRSGHKTTLTEL